ncbi:PPR repeat family protein [Candidatus Burarchaeum australiense]|nr:PPR repeat family protein [Candidatus Burarchaeum australiense]
MICIMNTGAPDLAEAHLKRFARGYPKVQRFSNILLNLYCKEGRLEEATQVFFQSIENGTANSVTGNTMLGICQKSKNIENGLEIFYWMKAEGLANVISHKLILEALYAASHFKEMQDIVSTAPADIQADTRVMAYKIDAIRKLKSYELAIKEIDGLLSTPGLDRREREGVLISKAYCLVNVQQFGEAEGIFRQLLKDNLTENHRVRVLCGLVFTHNVREDEAPEISAELESWRGKRNERSNRDIHCALKILTRQYPSLKMAAPAPV